MTDIHTTDLPSEMPSNTPSDNCDSDSDSEEIRNTFDKKAQQEHIRFLESCKSIELMTRYVVKGELMDDEEEELHDFYLKLGPKCMPETKDNKIRLDKYQEVLSSEFGTEVGTRFREIYEHNSNKIDLPHPYYFMDETIQCSIRMKMLFDYCYREIVNHKKKKFAEYQIKDLQRCVHSLAERITELEQRLHVFPEE